MALKHQPQHRTRRPSSSKSRPVPPQCAKTGHRMRLLCLTDLPISASVGSLSETSRLPCIKWVPRGLQPRSLRRRMPTSWILGKTKNEDSKEIDDDDGGGLGGVHDQGLYAGDGVQILPECRIRCEVCGVEAKALGWAAGARLGRGVGPVHAGGTENAVKRGRFQMQVILYPFRGRQRARREEASKACVGGRAQAVKSLETRLGSVGTGRVRACP